MENLNNNIFNVVKMIREPIVLETVTEVFVSGQEFIDKLIEFSDRGNDAFKYIVRTLQKPISNYRDRHLYLKVSVTLAQYNQLISICDSSNIDIKFKNHEMSVAPRIWLMLPLRQYVKDVDEFRELLIANNFILNFARSAESDQRLQLKKESYRCIVAINLVPIDEDLILHHVHNMIDQKYHISEIHKFITKTGFKHLNGMLYRYCEDNDIPLLIKSILS